MVAGALLGMAVKHAYDRGGEAEVMAATKKRREDRRRGDIERDRAMTDTLLKDHAEREKRRAQENKEKNDAIARQIQENNKAVARDREENTKILQQRRERMGMMQPPATPPGQDRDALRGRPKIVIPN